MLNPKDVVQTRLLEVKIICKINTGTLILVFLDYPVLIFSESSFKKGNNIASFENRLDVRHKFDFVLFTHWFRIRFF